MSNEWVDRPKATRRTRATSNRPPAQNDEKLATLHKLFPPIEIDGTDETDAVMSAYHAYCDLPKPEPVEDMIFGGMRMREDIAARIFQAGWDAAMREMREPGIWVREQVEKGAGA